MPNFQKFHISVKGLLKVNNEILFLQLAADNSNPEYMDLPGGRTDEKELIKDVIEREFREEIGLQIELKELKPIGINQRYKYKYADYGFCLCEIIHLVELDKKPVISLSHEHSAFHWINKDTDLNKFKYKNEEYFNLIKKFHKEYCT